MPERDANPTLPSPRRGVLIALALAIAATALLIGLQSLLSERIEINRQRARMQPLLQAFPAEQRDRVTLDVAGVIDDSDTLELQGPTPFYRARANGTLVGWLIPAIATQGYNGAIHLITAIDPNGKIIGTQVLSQRETPGLGDRIDRTKSAWLDNFSGRSLNNPSVGAWYLSKDGGRFDELTGATVTSRAVTRAVQRTLVYFRAHAAQWPAQGDGGANDHE